MSIGDFVLSGLCPSRFENVVPRLLEVCRHYGLAELQIWDLEDNFHRAVFGEGTGFEDAAAVLEFDHSRMKRIACVTTLTLAGVRARCVLNGERWRQRTVVCGLVYLDKLLSESTSQEAGLRALAVESGRLAVELEASFLGLASEDDRASRLVDGVLLQSPCVFLITVRPRMAPVGFAKKVESLGDATIEWLHDPAQPMEDVELDSVEVRRCREYLRGQVVEG